jgi:hypothetical protein
MPGYKPAPGHSDMYGNNMGFDLNKADRWVLLNPGPHFQALNNGNLSEFEDAIHYLSDFPYHNGLGYEAPLGHLWDSLRGNSPDDKNLLNESDNLIRDYIDQWITKYGQPKPPKNCGC